MIQRIQTVFMLLAVIALGLFLWLPVMKLEIAGNTTSIYKGWEVTHTLPFRGEAYMYFFSAILTGIAIAVTLVNIFLYKNRGVQTVLCWVSIFFIAAAGLFVYYKYQTKIFNGEVILTLWNVLTIIAVVFELLAYFYIRKDEDTIKSLDRLR